MQCYVIQQKKNPLTFNYNIENVNLSRPEVIKDLGVVFDPKLSFNGHISMSTRAAYKNLGFIIRNSKDFANRKTLVLLYNSFVRSRLEYASIVWSPLYTTYINNLESIQRSFLKFMYYKDNDSYPAIGFPHDVLLNTYNFVSLKDRRSMHSVIFLQKILNFTFDCPQILQWLNFNVPRRTSRSPMTFYLPTPQTNLLKTSPIFKACSDYCQIENNTDIFNCKIEDIKNKFRRRNP